VDGLVGLDGLDGLDGLNGWYEVQADMLTDWTPGGGHLQGLPSSQQTDNHFKASTRVLGACTCALLQSRQAPSHNFPGGLRHTLPVYN
jgi:hypothetical protein